MNIHIICADSQGFSKYNYSAFDIMTKLSFSSCSRHILGIEKAMQNAVKEPDSPQLIIIDNVLGRESEYSFRKIFAGIIYRAEKKVQDKPWIEVKKQLKHKKSKNTEDENTVFSRVVPYDKKKTHIFKVERESNPAYTFAYMGTQILVLPQDTEKEELASLTDKALAVFAESQEEFPQGYRLTPSTYKILTFREKYIPSKKDTSKERSRKAIRILACCVFIFAGILLLNKIVFQPLDRVRSKIEIQSQVYENETDPKTGEKIIKPKNLKKLKKINEDIVGWVKVNHTKIDYPVLHCKTDDSKAQRYLYRDYRGYSSGGGSIFVDYRSKKGLKSKNAILHGHHMIDGSMFGDLMKYGKFSGNVAFYKKAPTVQITTEKDGIQTYKIFSVFKSNVNPKQGEYFDFYCNKFESSSQFMNYVYNLRIRSLIDTPVTVNEKDQLLTLVTCSYEYQNFRTVVVARKCRKGESETVDTGLATAAKDPIWPQIYYSGRTRPTVSTFKTELEKDNVSWYDGSGTLKGEEELPTSTILPTEKSTKSKKSSGKKIKTYYKVQIYNGDSLLKIVQVKSGKSVKLPKIKTTYKKDGYKYTFKKWETKGSESYKKITQNTVITAIYTKAKITEKPKPTKATKATTQATKPTEKPIQATTAPETTEPSENSGEDIE